MKVSLRWLRTINGTVTFDEAGIIKTENKLQLSIFTSFPLAGGPPGKGVKID